MLKYYKLRLATILLRTLFFSTITIIGCKPNARLISYNQTRPDYKNQIDEAIDIFILGNLVVKYHEENRVWPKRPIDLNFADDTVKLLLTNFDTVNFNSSDNTIDVDYKFSKEREFLAPIEFIDPDSVSEEQNHIIWQELDDRKFQNNEFDGVLTITYDGGIYRIKTNPTKVEDSP
ncbi:MAG TPA: hypothetical protein VKZ51_04075 [Cyclobacteriaceae bacterium]|nr:hypothetical protein [Cyclobacteriaceae bacterium]